MPVWSASGMRSFSASAPTRSGITAFHGIDNGWLQLLLAIAGTAVVGALTGLVVLRTQGMAFIMITLAFAQMFFYLGVSLKEYGGDDGMSLPGRSRLAPLDLESDTQLYYLAFGLLVATLYLSWRLVHSRFGYVLRGIKSNERRMKALGFATTRYKLAIYIVAGMVAGSCRLPAGQPEQLRLAILQCLDRVGRTGGDGHPRRHRHCLRRRRSARWRC